MSLIKATSDSNASPSAGSRPESNASAGDGVGMLGYSIVPFPSQKPAQVNSDVSITANFEFTSVNQGTSITAYDEQPVVVNAESGS